MAENPPNLITPPVPALNTEDLQGVIQWARSMTDVTDQSVTELTSAIQELSRRIAALEP